MSHQYFQYISILIFLGGEKNSKNRISPHSLKILSAKFKNCQHFSGELTNAHGLHMEKNSWQNTHTHTIQMYRRHREEKSGDQALPLVSSLLHHRGSSSMWMIGC